jgi:hypothetical protein
MSAGCIGCAANDMSLIFKKAARELSSTFTVWSLRLTERCVEILLADVLVQFAAPLGLSTTMECILQMLVYCSCLEDTHRICLQPHMLRVLWPHIELVINAHVNRCARVQSCILCGNMPCACAENMTTGAYLMCNTSSAHYLTEL